MVKVEAVVIRERVHWYFMARCSRALSAGKRSPLRTNVHLEAAT